MRPNGKRFDGLNSLFENQQLLLKENIVGNALSLTYFTPVNFDHVLFANILLKTFCALDIRCAFTTTKPAYITGVLSSYYNQALRVSQVCIAKTDPAFLDRLFKKWPAFEIGPFQFRLSTEQEYVNFPDYADYDITHEGVTLPFHITFVDVSVHCGSQSSINL